MLDLVITKFTEIYLVNVPFVMNLKTLEKFLNFTIKDFFQLMTLFLTLSLKMISTTHMQHMFLIMTLKV